MFPEARPIDERASSALSWARSRNLERTQRKSGSTGKVDKAMRQFNANMIVRYTQNRINERRIVFNAAAPY